MRKREKRNKEKGERGREKDRKLEMQSSRGKGVKTQEQHKRTRPKEWKKSENGVREGRPQERGRRKDECPGTLVLTVAL